MIEQKATVSHGLVCAMSCFDVSNIGPACTLGALTGMIWLTMINTQAMENAAVQTLDGAYLTYSAPGQPSAGTGQTLHLLLWGSVPLESHKKWTG